MLENTSVRPLGWDIQKISQKLTYDKVIAVQGDQLLSQIDSSITEVNTFSKQWDHLTLDGYMGDGGTYRYRRYGQYEKQANSCQLKLLPHEPYIQSKEINPLNGDITRVFDPLLDDFSRSPILAKTLLSLTDLFDEVRGQSCDWNIRLHPYRIISTSNQVGQPTPEGLHRDGVTFITSIMIQRNNVKGGVTTTTDANRRTIDTTELSKPFDIVIADDEETMHEVSPVLPIKEGQPAIRDVLVIGFTQEHAC